MGLVANKKNIEIFGQKMAKREQGGKTIKIFQQPKKTKNVGKILQGASKVAKT